MQQPMVDSWRRAATALREVARIILSIAFVMLSTIIVLSLLNRAPALLQQPERTAFATVEEAETALGVRIPLPAYFPEFLGWPPAEVTATRNQTLVVSLVFPLRKTGEPALVIHQILRDEKENIPDLPLLQPERPLREVKVPIGAAFGALRSGTDRQGLRWSRLTWRAQDRDMILIASFSEQTLLTMARSIH